MFKLLLSLTILSGFIYANPQCYVQGYPDLVQSADENTLILKDGTKFPYHTNDSKSSWDEKINHADLATQLEQHYDAGGHDTPPSYLFDPGRLRYQPFFQALYGKDQKAIEKNLVQIKWPTLKGSINLPVTKVAGADKALYAIGQEIARLPKKDRIWAEGATTYCYRVIKDTDRLSMHSYGIAIDLAPNTTQYWKDEAPSETALIGYKNTMPLSIVQIFEKHGFIWGGRWYHYDTMHFEYRPELLAPSCQRIQ
ncbi:MAG: M15 family metallopeptidase [Sulfuricurvum sp.]|uniref:M15 family metallopeptidase n=1 Tax=Sulfuricurvum sp. TaxID=2025608 RepID=UPI00261C8CDD|nr:M15 family metallopeptidase [Sulfuricurvum sp.]MDD2828092.1 M15 family metallopeptidase [Sulfuricurvum sp.]MDD4948034.1 M15 family metallopeptidase [Sulfuricurvum sp.]